MVVFSLRVARHATFTIPFSSVDEAPFKVASILKAAYSSVTADGITTLTRVWYRGIQVKETSA